MRNVTNTGKSLNLEMPSMKDAGNREDRGKGKFTKKIETEAVLILAAGMLCGWLLFCLSCAFRNSTYLL